MEIIPNASAHRADEHGAVYPLLLSQLGMRNGQLAEPDNPAYSIAMVVWFEDPSGADVVRAAAAEVCREASAVNVVLGIDERGNWSQTVDLGIADDIAVLDFDGDPDPISAFTTWLANAVALPFALVGSPLLRQTVATVGNRVAYVAIAHHMVIDGYGAALLQRRLVAVYMARRHGLPIPAATFGTLAELTGSIRIPEPGDLQDWTEYLADGPDILSFTDEVAPPDPVPLTRHVAVRGVRRHGQIWTRLMIAAVAAYVARYTGMGEVVVGVPVSNRRNHAERRTPAMLMTVIPLRVQVPRAASPREIAQRVGQAMIELSRKPPQRAETLREAVPTAWRSGRLHGPIANIVPFEVETPDRSAPCAVEILNHGPVEDVSVLVAPTGDSDVRVELSMNPRLHSGQDADDHRDRLHRWMQAIADDPDRPLRDTPFLTSAEQRVHHDIAEEPGVSGPLTWDSPTTAGSLAAAAGFAGNFPGVTVSDDFGQPVPFGRHGRVHLSGPQGPIATELLASVDRSGIAYRGSREDFRIVNGRAVELERLAHELARRDEVLSARPDPDPGAARLLVRLTRGVEIDDARRRLGHLVPRGVRFRFDRG